MGSVSFTWIVKAVAPTLSNPGPQTNNEGAVLSGATAIKVTVTGADPGTFTDVVSGVHTLPPGLTINPNSGVISGNHRPPGGERHSGRLQWSVISATHDNARGTAPSMDGERHHAAGRGHAADPGGQPK